MHIADIKPEIDPEVDNQALLAEYPDIINILSQIIKHPKVNELPIKVDFNSADSVAYHLAGLIPLTSIARSKIYLKHLMPLKDYQSYQSTLKKFQAFKQFLSVAYLIFFLASL